MFCPNCGNDGGNFNYCPYCGQELRTNNSKKSLSLLKQELVASGQVFCPQCLSTSISACPQEEELGSFHYYRSIGSKIIGLLGYLIRKEIRKQNGTECICLKCGHRWYLPKLELKERHKIYILNKFEGQLPMRYTAYDGGYLEIDDTFLSIFNPEQALQKIPYEKLDRIRFVHGYGPLNGWISFRNKENPHPFPKSFEEAKGDASTFLYDLGDEHFYKKIYTILNEIVETNRSSN